MNVGYTEGKIAVGEVRKFLKGVESRLDGLDTFIAEHVDGPCSSFEIQKNGTGGFKAEFLRKIKDEMLGRDDMMKVDYETPVFMWALEKARKRILRGPVIDTILGFFFMVMFIIVAIILMVAITPSAEAQIIITDVPQGERVVAIVTAYTSSVDETDSRPFENASGTRPGPGSVACPVRYAFGTRVLIKGQEYTCDDRMHQRFSDRFDVWMYSKAEAFEFGKKRVEVAVIN